MGGGRRKVIGMELTTQVFQGFIHVIDSIHVLVFCSDSRFSFFSVTHSFGIYMEIRITHASPATWAKLQITRVRRQYLNRDFTPQSNTIMCCVIKLEKNSLCIPSVVKSNRSRKYIAQPSSVLALSDSTSARGKCYTTFFLLLIQVSITVCKLSQHQSYS